MLLDDVLEHNRSFVRGRESRPFPPPETFQLVVVACYDPRLDALLPAALGIDPGKAFFLRAAGTVVRPEGDPLRSLALAVFMFGVTDVFVVGHSSCRMAQFSSAPFIDAFRARGVQRESFGPGDLREWVGAIPDPKRGVQASVAAIAGSRFLPADLTLAGLVLDDTTGALETVVAPVRAGAAVTVPEPTAHSAFETAPVVEAPAPPPPHVVAPEPAAASSPLAREADAVRAFVDALESSAGWRQELQRLRGEIERQRSPLVRLALVEKFLKKSSVNARGVAVAFEKLKKESAAAGRELELERLVDLFLRRERPS